MPLRRRLAAAALLLGAPAMTACGFNIQTDQIYQPGVGVDNRSGTVDVLAAVVVSAKDGTGTFVATLVNNDLDKAITLERVQARDLEAQLGKPIEVPANGLVNMADLGAIAITGSDVAPGGFARVTLEFSNGQDTTVNVPIVDDSGDYADVTLAGGSESPSASPTP